MHRLQDARGDPRAADRLIARAAHAGRFAPTPSGPLHVGSLIAALASRCQALSRGGRWALRIDDIDPPRERPGASAAIVRTLERYGFVPDGPVLYQSTRLEAYRAALGRLAAAGLLYECRCTRRALRGLDRYPGTCRPPAPVAAGTLPATDPVLERAPRAVPDAALRVRLDGPIRLEDAVQGRLEGRLEEICGDVVLRRRDGLVAYPLACAVDDAAVEEVVRGADLLEASAAQHAVLERLGERMPARAHVPVALDREGRKLGKSTDAPPADALAPLPTLLAAWGFLGQAPLAVDSLEAFWREAPRRWSLAAVPRRPALPAPPPVTTA